MSIPTVSTSATSVNTPIVTAEGNEEVKDTNVKASTVLKSEENLEKTKESATEAPLDPSKKV